MIAVCDRSQGRRIRVSRRFFLAEVQVVLLFCKLYVIIWIIQVVPAWPRYPSRRGATLHQSRDAIKTEITMQCNQRHGARCSFRLKHSPVESIVLPKACLTIEIASPLPRVQKRCSLVWRSKSWQDFLPHMLRSCARVCSCVCVRMCVWLLRVRMRYTFLLKDLKDRILEAKASNYSISFMLAR